MIDDFQHQEEFSVRAYAVNAQKQIQVPVLVQLMHETAMQHVLKLKLSVWDLEPQNLAWVLTRITIKIHQLPKLGDRIRIVTNPSGFEKIRTYRDYRVFNEAGDLLATAVSQWFLMNTQTRRLARVPTEIKELIETVISKIDDFLPRNNDKPAPFTEVNNQRNYQVGYHDLDFNDHLNNIHYVKWLLDAIPGTYLQQHELQGLDIFYKSECALDELVSSEVNQPGELSWQHRLVKDGQEVTLAESRWRAMTRMAAPQVS